MGGDFRSIIKALRPGPLLAKKKEAAVTLSQRFDSTCIVTWQGPQIVIPPTRYTAASVELTAEQGKNC